MLSGAGPALNSTLKPSRLELLRFGWRRCGSFGELSCFSFYANKLVTSGEGGMVVTDDEALAGQEDAATERPDHDLRVDLLPREFKLLEYFMRRPNQIVTRAMLLEDVWNYKFLPQTNVVDVHIGNLRRKIDAGGEPRLIVNVRAAGFKLHVDD